MSINTKVVTNKVRFSYAHVWRPAPAPNGDPQSAKYSVSLLIPKSDKQTVAKIKAAMEAAITEGIGKFNGKKPNPATLHLPLRDGDAERPDDPAYAGMYFMNCSSKAKPGLIDRAKNEILDESEFYSGCWGRASVNLYAYNVNGNRGIAAGLNNLQKLEDGEPLGGGRTKAEDDFNDGYTDEETDDWGI